MACAKLTELIEANQKQTIDVLYNLLAAVRVHKSRLLLPYNPSGPSGPSDPSDSGSAQHTRQLTEQLRALLNEAEQLKAMQKII